MPAWITSELRELVCVPIASSASRMITSRPASASSRAIASPTTPAPTTTASTLSTREPPFERKGGEAGKRGGGGHRARGAVEKRAEQRAENCAGGLAEHYAGKHPAVGVDCHAHVRQGKCRARDPREDAHLAREKQQQRCQEAPIRQDAAEPSGDLRRVPGAPLDRRGLAQADGNGEQ